MHSPRGIFDVTIAFLDPENVDFNVLYAILLTFWYSAATYSKTRAFFSASAAVLIRLQ